MHAGDTIYGGEIRTYRGGSCEIRFPEDGNFASGLAVNDSTSLAHKPWSGNQNSFCLGSTTETMSYTLQADGNFVAYCGSQLDYTTHTGQGEVGHYFMAIDSDCRLSIYKGFFDCYAIHIDAQLWRNIRTKSLRPGDRLGKGEWIEGRYNLIMQPTEQDGNLVYYELSSSGSLIALWGANEEWVGPPAPEFHDYYATVTYDGRLLLVGIQYMPDNSLVETVYFEKDLQVESSCFTMEYDKDADDVVGVPCAL